MKLDYEKLKLFNLIVVTYTGLLAWAKSNLGMLMEVGDSLWIVLKANISLLFSTITSLFSVLIGSGHAMLKFLFNSVRIESYHKTQIKLKRFNFRLYFLLHYITC
jgi:hypothetical protein